MDWFFGLLSAAQWDALRNWLTTLGGLVALLVALRTYRANAETRRESQARFVYSKIVFTSDVGKGEEFSVEGDYAIEQGAFSWGPSEDPYAGPAGMMRFATQDLGRVVVRIHNESDELIGPVKVLVADTYSGEVTSSVAAIIPVIEPKRSIQATLVWTRPGEFGVPDDSPVIIFRDASGQWWKRFGTHPIESIHDDPENSAPTKSQRNLRAALVAGVGMTPDKLHVPVRARWHRLLRRIQGKSPTP